MRRFFLLLTLLAAGALVASAPAQPAPAGLSNWPFDEITLKNGAKFQGMLLAELPDGYEFRSVYRLPGRPTVTLTSFFGKGDVSIALSLGFTAAFLAVCLGVIGWIFKTGWRLKN